MNVRVFACLLSLISAPAVLAQRADFQRMLSVSEHADVYVSTGSGDVHISQGDDRQLTVVGHVHASSMHSGDAEDRIRRILADPPIQQSGNDVHIGDAPNRSLFNNISIDYEIRAPRGAALNLHTGSGDLDVENVGRYLAATSGSGTIRVRGLSGAANLETGSGDIELQQAGAGEVRAGTGSGSVRLRGLNGPLHAHTGSGEIEAEGRLQGPSELRTGSGSVRLRLAPGSGMHLAASTGSGSMRVHLPGENVSSESHHSLEASLFGGGPDLEVHTGSGDIEVSSQ